LHRPAAVSATFNALELWYAAKNSINGCESLGIVHISFQPSNHPSEVEAGCASHGLAAATVGPRQRTGELKALSLERTLAAHF